MIYVAKRVFDKKDLRAVSKDDFFKGIAYPPMRK
jgi:hypothetical protein